MTWKGGFPHLTAIKNAKIDVVGWRNPPCHVKFAKTDAVGCRNPIYHIKDPANGNKFSIRKRIIKKQTFEW